MLPFNPAKVTWHLAMPETGHKTHLSGFCPQKYWQLSLLGTSPSPAEHWVFFSALETLIDPE